VDEYTELMSQSEDSTPEVKGEQISLKTIKAWHSAAVNADDRWWDRLQEDWRFFENDQWSQDQKAELKKRKQPPFVLNHIHRDLYIQLGRQIKARMRPGCKARGNGDKVKARALTDVARYYLDVNKFDFEQTQAIKDQLVGRGWLHYCFQKEDLSKEHIRIEYVPWHEIRFDPYCKRNDLGDAANLFRERWADLDVVAAQYPGKAEELRRMVSGGSEGGGDKTDDRDTHPSDGYRDEFDKGGQSVGYMTKDRKRVRLVECWYRRTIRADQARWPDSGRTEVLNPDDPQQAQRLANDPKWQLVKDAPVKQIYYVIFAGDVILAQGPSPYKHGMFPYVPYHAFRSGVLQQTDDLAPGEPFGMVRIAKGPQLAKNMIFSKTLHILNGSGGTYKKGAVKVEDLRQNAAKVDGWTAVTEHDDVRPWDRSAQAANLVRLLPILDENLEAGTGVNEASRGVGPRQSGTALQERQETSETTNAILVDMQRLAIQMGGWMLVSMIQQSVTDEKIVRITEDVGDRVVAVNVTDPERQAELEAHGVEVHGDITTEAVDLIVDEMPAEGSALEAANAFMLEMGQALGPQGLLAIADLYVENQPIRNKEQFMERISQLQQMAGIGEQPQPDPAQMEMQQAQMQAQQAMMGADVQTKQAGAQKAEADALKAQAEAQGAMQEAALGGQRQQVEMAMQMAGHEQKLRHGDEAHKHKLNGMGRPA